jgi:Na+/H+ antiporter NhaC
MWIIPIILVVFILLAFIGLRDDKKNLNTTTKKLKVIENTYNITASFTSTAGFLAFNDEEKSFIISELVIQNLLLLNTLISLNVKIFLHCRSTH